MERDWLTKDEWLSEKNNLKETTKNKVSTIKWYYTFQGKRFGPMKKTDLIKTLKEFPSIRNVKVWHKELEGWVSVFEFKDIVFSIGHENRKNLGFQLMNLWFLQWMMEI